jgi:hypothetical protein
MRPFIFSLIFLLAAIARADLSFNLTPATLPGVGTNKIVFTGILSNSITATNFLNNIQINFSGAATNYFTADTNVFFENVPGILLPGENYSDIVFGIFVTSNTPPGNYFGAVTIQGGSDIFAANNLTNQSFQISLPPATMRMFNSGTNFVISWPFPPGSSTLQQNSNLATASWTAVTNASAATNFQKRIFISPSGGSHFYRLTYP